MERDGRTATILGSGRLVGCRVLLIVGGGIAAYKALELIRRLRAEGASVIPVLTAGACRFITPLSAAALAENRAFTDLFDPTDEGQMGHIALSREADLVLVCPATADLLARMAAGLADDLATTLLLATDRPVMVAPAMNVRMWDHPATRANVATLRARGVEVVEPDVGPMACGEFGPGRLPEPDALLEAVVARLAPGGRPLKGVRAVVTAGPTHEPIDPVRYLANRSSGRQGFAIAGALAGLGARVTLVAGPVCLPTPPGVDRVDVETACQMAEAVERALPADLAVMVAAVADWRVEPAPAKLKKDEGAPLLRLVENPDILKAVAAAGPRRPRLVVGFAAETGDPVAAAQRKLRAKGCDLVVANDVSGGVMGGDRNRVHLVSASGVESWPELPKDEVARRLARALAARLTEANA
ncbi:MAG: bifunctional phosphopantothenoylcysteine decarboxylase/phosphopantothenate--cysteine ligase CoaBC [Sphingomonadaceae bacterium]|uniref:bifunctional phosphopantothenoylcysteine decarboxylase/phosphopantothenate--cysteine ligase CoaBC n=1 Tax=Thermaurantiacus sp. TaxID=2820283 RepID=UPI00298EFE64|nr:bifunctional phosphopantothenoylcysteine decarboxylase/phosphopantothenate--cysteine ligase CoaBC [Thermaurantiacus sp.]MCS6986894.1 bifunctional phosphopantothenoylcysteine decarboxylase/phosphopantothenate--cysteine ligase CoaBC [Sphingomonadaceae bacterium]MDW8415506.1 bifunctional phosphopantothenoylcysteine decarboxylase/phosphopantothenate--cysteine ligase CoaBC [Thermaurantiacus sp.]